MPKILDETYDRILCSIDQECHKITITALRWLIFANSPLKLREVAEATLIQPDQEVPFDAENRFCNPYGILQVLYGLVIMATDEPASNIDYEFINLR